MNEQIQRIIDDSYDESKEEGLRSLVKDFYNRRHTSSIIVAWLVGAAYLALAAYSAVHFFQSDTTRLQILYATLFLVGVQGMALVKHFTWQLTHRHSLKRDIKRLELQVAVLAEAVKK